MEPLTNSQQELYNWLVDYVRANQHSPSTREMMQAMNLRSPASVLERLEHLRDKGYIEWSEGKSRTIRIRDDMRGVPILGVIVKGFVQESHVDCVERLDLSNFFQSGNFALKVTGDSMIDARIQDGDVIIMRPVISPKCIQDGTIVAARVESGTTLKSFYREGNNIQLRPANLAYPTMEFPAELVDIFGCLIGVWRGIDPDFAI